MNEVGRLLQKLLFCSHHRGAKVHWFGDLCFPTLAYCTFTLGFYSEALSKSINILKGLICLNSKVFSVYVNNRKQHPVCLWQPQLCPKIRFLNTNTFLITINTADAQSRNLANTVCHIQTSLKSCWPTCWPSTLFETNPRMTSITLEKNIC